MRDVSNTFFTALLCLILGFLTLVLGTKGAAAQVFGAYYEPSEAQLYVRLDHLTEDLQALPIVGVEASVDGNTITLPLTGKAQFEHTILSINIRKNPKSIRIRFVYMDGPSNSVSHWSPPQPVTVLSHKDTNLDRITPDMWSWRAHPTRSDHLQIRFSDLPYDVTQMSSLSVRTGLIDTGLHLPPEIDRWIDVPLRADRLGRERPFSLFVAANMGKRGGLWGQPKNAILRWLGQSRVPDALWSTDWMIRATGSSGTALITIVQPPATHGATLLGLDTRITPVNDRFEPINDTSTDWRRLDLSPTQDGRLQSRVTGLRDGQRYTVELRGISNIGPGRASAPKQIITRHFDLPAQAVIGDLNGRGQGRIRIPKNDQITDGQGWRIEPAQELDWDWLVPTRRTPQPGVIHFASGHKLTITQASDTFVAVTQSDLQAFLRLRSRHKSGATLQIGPHWLNTQDLVGHFDGAFSGLDAPLTIVPREPAYGTQISRWWFGSARSRDITANVTMRDLDFYYPEALWTLAGQPSALNVIDTRHSRGLVQDLTFQRVHIASDAMPSRLGYRQSTRIRAADFQNTQGVSFVDGEISHIVYGLRVGLIDSLTRGNTMRHIIADPININMNAGDQGRDIIIEHNTAYDFMGDGFFLHGDGTHMWVAGGSGTATARIERLKYRGNIFFPGHEGILAPPVLPAIFDFQIRTADTLLGATDDHKLLRFEPVNGPLVVTLPKALASRGLIQKRDPNLTFALQKGQGDYPVIIRTASGDRFGEGGVTELRLTKPFDAVELHARPGTNSWDIRVPTPALQGFYADDRGTELPGLEMEANIFWGLSVRQISPGNAPSQGARVHHNTVLIPMPGDLDRDGYANTTADGTNRRAGNILVSAADPTVQVFANIAGRTVPQDNLNFQPQAFNNLDIGWTGDALRPSDIFQAFLTRGTEAQAARWFPETRSEAIALARPKRGSKAAAAGIGPLGPTPNEDWWNFETGMRNGQDSLQPVFKSPATNSEISAQAETLHLAFNTPLARVSGQIFLIDADNGEIMHLWRLHETDPNVQLDGATLTLTLPLRLEPGRRYLINLSAAEITDTLGHVWGPDSQFEWSFHTINRRATNLLADNQDLSQKPWHPLQISVRAPTESSSGLSQLIANEENNRLRLVLPAQNDLNSREQMRLYFLYQLAEGQVAPISQINAPARIRIQWSDLQDGEVTNMGTGLHARSTDVSAQLDQPPGTSFIAELMLPSRLLTETLDLDLVRRLPVGTPFALGGVTLHPF